MSYIGSAELESGLFSTSHLWDWRPFDVTEEVVEEGYFYKVGKPSEGLRAVWVPKDMSDADLWSE